MAIRHFRLGALRLRIAVAPAGTRFAWLHFDRPSTTAVHVVPMFCAGTARNGHRVQRFVIVGRLALHFERERSRPQSSIAEIEIVL